MDVERINSIKRLVIKAIFSDDEFLDLLVLKGGNAVDLIYDVALRGSIDLDFSLERDFPEMILEPMRVRFSVLLNRMLNASGFDAIDVTFEPRPPEVSAELEKFWGGYLLEFKVVDREKVRRAHHKYRDIRNAAEIVGPGQLRTFSVEFSRFEYCRDKQEHEIDGYTIYVYSPEMLVCEKIRAICQQMPEYSPIVRRIRQISARAKDFFDIHTLVERFHIELSAPSNFELIRAIFDAKRVPLSLIGRIAENREFHRLGFASVQDTVKPGVHLQSYDYYFDFLIELVRALQPLWME